MDDFVVAQNENEVFFEGVKEGEGDVALVKFAVTGIAVHEVEKVVHPAEIPFQTKTKTSQISGLGNARPGGAFFSDGKNSGEAGVTDFVEGL